MSPWARPVFLTLLSALTWRLGALVAAEPAAGPSRGDRMLRDYFRAQVKQIADGCLTDLTTREEWERRRPELRRCLHRVRVLRSTWWPPSFEAWTAAF